MALRTLVSGEGKGMPEKITRILALGLLGFLLVIAGNVACKKATEEEVVSEEESSIIKEGINTFEGVVKAGVGKYFYIPEVKGLDIIVQGQMESGDASTLVGKEVRGEGEFSVQRPSILIANGLEVKESEGEWRNVFTRAEEFTIDDFLSLRTRDKFKALKSLSYDKKEGWEGKERAKVYGMLIKETITEGEQQKDKYKLYVYDEEGKEVGTVLVDSITDYALYYIEKLKLFEKFWCYITIKETVPWNLRWKSGEMFHADVLCTGLF